MLIVRTIIAFILLFSIIIMPMTARANIALNTTIEADDCMRYVNTSSTMTWVEQYNDNNANSTSGTLEQVGWKWHTTEPNCSFMYRNIIQFTMPDVDQTDDILWMTLNLKCSAKSLNADDYEPIFAVVLLNDAPGWTGSDYAIEVYDLENVLAWSGSPSDMTPESWVSVPINPAYYDMFINDFDNSVFYLGIMDIFQANGAVLDWETGNDDNYVSFYSDTTADKEPYIYFEYLTDQEIWQGGSANPPIQGGWLPDIPDFGDSVFPDISSFMSGVGGNYGWIFLLGLILLTLGILWNKGKHGKTIAMAISGLWICLFVGLRWVDMWILILAGLIPVYYIFRPMLSRGFK